jgi:hypothetical protein
MLAGVIPKRSDRPIAWLQVYIGEPGAIRIPQFPRSCAHATIRPVIRPKRAAPAITVASGGDAR